MSDNLLFFRDTAEKIFADTVDSNLIEAAEKRVPPQAMLDTLSENGIMMMLVPEEKGGIGASLIEANAILEAAGHAAAPGPILETMLAQSLLSQAGLEGTQGTIALGFCAADLDGNISLHDVNWGGGADNILIIANDAGKAKIALTPASDWEITGGENAACEPCDTLQRSALPPLTDAGDFNSIMRNAALLRAGQQIGAINWIFQRTAEYCGERKQFGREIAKFQVVQQMLAELAGHVLACNTLLDAAASTMNDALIAAAISRIADASDAAIAIGHQVHAAIGFSKEYPLNYRTRRLMAWREDFRGVQYWRGFLGGHAARSSRDELWPMLAATGLQTA